MGAMEREPHMSIDRSNPRVPAAEVDAIFPDRWSPRALLPDAIPEHQAAALFEAARWAPSCYNEQPWLFVYAADEDGRRRLAAALVEKNRSWAARAPLLAFLAARRHFDSDGRPNRYAAFDAGAAWMSLALQARRLGLYAHAMAGFDQDRAHEILGLPKDQYEILVAIAVGRRGEPSQLPEDLRPLECPNARKPAEQVARPAGGGNLWETGG